MPTGLKMVDALEALCQQYDDGCLGDREFMGSFLQIVGEKWNRTPEAASKHPDLEVTFLVGAVPYFLSKE